LAVRLALRIALTFRWRELRLALGRGVGDGATAFARSVALERRVRRELARAGALARALAAALDRRRARCDFALRVALSFARAVAVAGRLRRSRSALATPVAIARAGSSAVDRDSTLRLAGPLAFGVAASFAARGRVRRALARAGTRRRALPAQLAGVATRRDIRLGTACVYLAASLALRLEAGLD
jgi:hypothetical protein